MALGGYLPARKAAAKGSACRFALRMTANGKSSANCRVKVSTQTTGFYFWLWLIRIIGVIAPGRLCDDWRQEWEAELRHRERLPAEWDRLDWRNKLELLRSSASAFWDALCLQP